MLKGNKPSSTGSEIIEIERAPVSLQANSTRKREFKEYVASLLTESKYLLSGDVQIHIDWYIHEQKRYETSTSADIDNIIKPLLDAFCGPEGIMIDDNQVQSVTCNWIDYHDTEKERLVVTVKYIPDDIVIKEGLFFVDVGDNLYMPLFDYLTPEIKKLMLSMYEKMVDARNQMMEAGLDYYSTKGIMSVQRVFHKGRLEGFVLKSKEEL